MAKVLHALTFLGIIAITKSVNVKYGQVSPSCELNHPSVQEYTLTEYVSINPADKPLVISCGHRVTVEKNYHGTLAHGLRIEGELHFEDGGNIHLRTPFVIVRGYLFAGSVESPFQGRLVVELLDSSSNIVLDNLSPRNKFKRLLNFGTKAFATYGGRVTIVGAASGPLYTHLIHTAVPGNKRIRVADDVKDKWNVGDVIAIAPSAIPYRDYSSMNVISGIRQNSDGSCTIFLKNIIRRFHSVRHIELTDGSNRDMQLRPEVVRINRNVMVTGMPLDTNLDNWLNENTPTPHGGHFIMAHSAEPQTVIGVEFAAMGQAGILGRYPLHFHFSDDASHSIAAWNSIHHSKQRCLVVHASHNLLVENNVAFRTAGHCFMTEDGIEVGNTFRGNIGMATRRAVKVIKMSSRDKQTDDSPATFWMASPTNDIVGNVAAGSQGSGFWYELHGRLRGSARNMKLPRWRKVNMQRANFGLFRDNVAHSAGQGLRTYSPGSHPEKTAYLENFYAWTVSTGFHTPIGSNQVLRNATMVDVSYRGVDSHMIEGYVIEDSVIVGERHGTWSCGRGHRMTGIHLEGDIHSNRWYYGLRGIILRNVHLQEFVHERNCKWNVGINIRIDESLGWFPSASSFEKVTYTNVDQFVGVEYTVAKHRQVAFQVSDAGHPDVDGTGYMVTTGFEGESILGENCQPAGRNLTNLLYCKGECWRHVSLAWNDPPGYPGTFLRVSRAGREFDMMPEYINQYVGEVVTRLVSRVMPADDYVVTLMDRNKNPVPEDIYDIWTFWFIRPDQHKADAPCDGDIHFLVHGKPVEEAI